MLGENILKSNNSPLGNNRLKKQQCLEVLTFISPLCKLIADRMCNA